MTTVTLVGIEELRAAVLLFDNTRESFNLDFTAEELLQIARMQRASGWDFCPDQWTARQVREALKGVPPRWDENERPVYAGKVVGK
jgi:hypothetical protein